MSHQVVVTLTDEEYENVSKLAKIKGLSISQYVKRYEISDVEFDRRYEYLKSKAMQQPINSTFTVMELFEDWDKIDRGVKLSLGRCFYHLVKAGKLSGVKATGKNSSSIQQYTVFHSE